MEKKKNYFTAIFGKWNLFEILLFFIGVVVVCVAYAVEPNKKIWALISSVSGILCVVMTAKGNCFAQFVSIVFALAYAYNAYTEKYYGETLIYLFLMTPIHVACIVSWLKNRSSNEKTVVKVNTLKAKEFVFMFLGDIVATFAFYFILKELGTEELIVSTISLVSSVSAAYLMLRRSEYYAVCFIVNDIILLVLWGLKLKVSLANLPTVLTFVVFLVNDVYGFISWRKRKAEQE